MTWGSEPERAHLRSVTRCTGKREPGVDTLCLLVSQSIGNQVTTVAGIRGHALHFEVCVGEAEGWT